MTTFLDVLPVDFKQTSDLLHSKIVESRFFRLGHTRRMEDIEKRQVVDVNKPSLQALSHTPGLTGTRRHPPGS
jgi:hypothetical protein